jgi:HSP20 family protein
MAESGASRQRSNEKEEQRGIQTQQQGPVGMQGRGGGYFPSISSLTPRDFFTISPLGLMRRFADEMDRAFANFGGISTGTSVGQELIWAPPIELREQDGNLVVSAELPGLTNKDVKVEATEDGLVIQGERKQEFSGEEGGVHRSERSYGRFWRLVPLPEGAQVENAQANFHDGILEVTIPVPESQQKRRQIPISSGGAGGGQGGAQSGGTTSPARTRSASQGG